MFNHECEKDEKENKKVKKANVANGPTKTRIIKKIEIIEIKKNK